MYSLEYSGEARKNLKKLPTEISKRVIFALERFRIRPHNFAKKLVNSPYFRFRCGDYRIIVDIQGDKLIILVIEIAHRKKVYK